MNSNKTNNNKTNINNTNINNTKNNNTKENQKIFSFDDSKKENYVFNPSKKSDEEIAEFLLTPYFGTSLIPSYKKYKPLFDAWYKRQSSGRSNSKHRYELIFKTLPELKPDDLDLF